MSFDPLTAALDLGKIAIEKIWPDPSKRAMEILKLEQLAQDGNLQKLNAHIQLMLGQIEINLADSKSGKWYQAGWRPAIGWTGAITLALMYIPKTIVLTVLWTWQNVSVLIAATDPSLIIISPFPNLGVSDIIGLLGSMLGVAGMRSYDKKNKTDTK